MIKAINPAKNYQVIDRVEPSTPAEIRAAVAAAHQAKHAWKDIGVGARAELLRTVKAKFMEHEKQIAQLITQEIGMAASESIDEVGWDWGYWDWFLDHVGEILQPETTLEDETSLHQVFYEPIGVAAVITPWNLPFDMFLWGVIPSLLAGNPVVYKAAEQCILSGKLYAKIMAECDLPKGVFNAIHGDAAQGEQLVDEEIDLIWFTGSSIVGQKLYEKAGKKFIKAVLEMGGSNPVIIFEDANIDSLISTITFKRFSFCGQTCDAMKRLIVHNSKYDEVIKKLSEKVMNIKVGDPKDPATQMGSLASKEQLELLESQVEAAVSDGATIRAQGKVDPQVKGAFYPPTILGDIKTNMRVWREEVFGPVLPVISFQTEEEAINLANDTQYGLSAQVYSGDKERALRVARHMQTGSVDINGASHFKPQNPFGGCKLSGMGREHGAHGLRELTQIKVISQAR